MYANISKVFKNEINVFEKWLEYWVSTTYPTTQKKKEWAAQVNTAENVNKMSLPNEKKKYLFNWAHEMAIFRKWIPSQSMIECECKQISGLKRIDRSFETLFRRHIKSKPINFETLKYIFGKLNFKPIKSLFWHNFQRKLCLNKCEQKNKTKKN